MMNKLILNFGIVIAISSYSTSSYADNMSCEREHAACFNADRTRWSPGTPVCDAFERCWRGYIEEMTARLSRQELLACLNAYNRCARPGLGASASTCRNTWSGCAEEKLVEEQAREAQARRIERRRIQREERVQREAWRRIQREERVRRAEQRRIQREEQRRIQREERVQREEQRRIQREERVRRAEQRRIQREEQRRIQREERRNREVRARYFRRHHVVVIYQEGVATTNLRHFRVTTTRRVIVRSNRRNTINFASGFSVSVRYDPEVGALYLNGDPIRCNRHMMTYQIGYYYRDNLHVQAGRISCRPARY